MLIVIDGSPRSGKSWFQNFLLNKYWKKGQNIFVNYEVHFSELNERITRFNTIDETFYLKNGVIGFDEAQDLFGYWSGMPIQFRNLLSHHGHRGLEAIANCQSYHDLHSEARRMIGEIYHVTRIFRLPFFENVKPWLLITRITHHERNGVYSNGDPKFSKNGRSKFYFISKFWTKELYDTHSNIDNDRFICELIYEKKNPDKKGEWTYKMTDRDVQMNKNR
jgi:hypothetical protein